jgi:DNA-directed RNA polymerase subunit RPC12/RpoP
MTSEQQREQYREAEDFEAQREYKCPDCGGHAFYMGSISKLHEKET